MVARWVDDVHRADTKIKAKHRSPSAGFFSDDYDTGTFKNPLNITLYNAMGGRIIKFSSYDDHNDRNIETTYIVSNDENFEEALGKFIALEAMKFKPND